MDGFFVVVACISLLCAIAAVLRVRAIGWAVWLWFFVEIEISLFWWRLRNPLRPWISSTVDFFFTLRAVDF